MNVILRLIGRIQMNARSADIHPDAEARRDCRIRAFALATAVNDIEQDEEIQAGLEVAQKLLLLHREKGGLSAMTTDDYVALEQSLDRYAKAVKGKS